MDSLFTGTWLAILSPTELDSIDDAYYVGAGVKRTGPIDYANSDYNKRGLFQWERTMINEYFPPCGSIALVAAGGGREVLALRRLSFRVDAWECQPELVDAANRLLVAEGFEPSVSFAPRNTIPTGSATYEALIIGWGAYTLIKSRSSRVALLRQLRARVPTGSPLLLSFFTRRPGGVHFRLIAALGNVGRRLLGRELVEVGDALAPNFIRLFLKEEIVEELAAGGFELKHFSRAPYGHAIALATGPDTPPAAAPTPRSHL